ncbi:substrate-binding domain-containing protein [Kineococcus sp. TRM81007]|uniref:LacI family DNA-binding transcriptional regulator n=1 Tax=Kineococcus sp. TRM81007 TaxID=2925831 RepID=UPI001F5AB28B|nr:substrate-binding domain-containing protein [Kineococcus sp. TRM81007]MCI2237035.1 substrate-binding domain-containing protein [Kineococcus sp. TRM81007]
MSGGSGLVGLVLAGGAPRVGVEPFFMELVAGMEAQLRPDGRSVLLLVVADEAAEVETYRRWAGNGTVDAVVVVNLTLGDVRPAELQQLGLPAVLAGHHPDTSFSSVVTDDAGAMRAALRFLASLGHRVVGRVAGPGELVHTQERNTGMLEEAERSGLDVRCVEADYTAARGVAAMRELLDSPAAPTALVFDNDVMAVAATEDLVRRGVDVPGAVSVLACDDSPLCEMTVPGLSALNVDVHEHGVRLGDAVLDLLLRGATGPRPGPPVRVAERASTGPAR